MDLVEVLKDYDWNGSAVGDRKLEQVDYFEEYPVMLWTYLIVIVISTIVGNVGNFLIIASVLSYEKLRTKANVFVISLAVADSCVATVVQYFSITGLILGYSFFMDKNWLCHTVASICQISCAASLLNMIAVAINRYICICRNAWYHKVYTKRNLTLIVMVVWFLAFLIDFPQFWGWGGHAFDNKTMLCSWNRLADLSYSVFFATIITLPSPVILFCYISIFVHVQNSRKEILKMGGRIDKGGANSFSVQLAKSLFIVFMFYLACWVPYALVVAIDFADRWPKAVHVFTIQFAHTNSSINSIIYGFSNPAFRKGYIYVLKKIFGACCPCFLREKLNRSSASSRRRMGGKTEESVCDTAKAGHTLSPGDKKDLDDSKPTRGDSFKVWPLHKKRSYKPSEVSAVDSVSMCTSVTDISVKSLPM